jgi:hypothetical protein
MFRSTARSVLALSFAAVVAVGCGSDSPTTPTPNATTLTAPKPVEPAANAQIADSSQPVTLTVENATTTGKNALTYVFEIASDDQFAAKVYSLGGVAAGASGKTSQQVNRLPAAKTYYWRVRAEDATAGAVGAWTATQSFTIGNAIRIDPPSPLEPVFGAPIGGTTPLFRIRNSTRAANAGAMSYTFDIAETSDFATLVTTGTAVESPSGETQWRANKGLVQKTYYWRVKAVDANNAQSAYSVSHPFRALPDQIDATTVVYLHGPNFSSWPITRTLTDVTQGVGAPDEVCTYFTHQGEWPSVIFYNEPDVLVEGNQWYFAKIGGRWYGVPGEWFRPGVSCKFGQAADAIGRDSTSDEPFHSWVPRPGESVGYAVSTPARNYPSMMSVDERSQITLLPWR